LTTLCIVVIVRELALSMGIPAMTYKLCTRCQFIVPSKNKLCTTCGCSKFIACDAPAEHGDEPAVVALRPHVRHVGSASARRELKEKITGEQQKLQVIGTHRALRSKFAELQSIR